MPDTRSKSKSMKTARAEDQSSATCSRSKKAAEPENFAVATETPSSEGAVVPINWLFLDQSKPDNCGPRIVSVRRSIFEGSSQQCRGLFVTQLSEEFKFEASEISIQFWKPKKPLLLETPYESGWIDVISKVKDHFDPIPLPRSFAKALAGQLENTDVVHLVVTAEGTYQGVAVAEEHDGDDVAAELPEIHRYKKIVSTPGKAPSTSAKSKEYARAQADDYEAIHDGKRARTSGFSTVAPPIHIFHPIFDAFVQRVDNPSVKLSDEDLRRTQKFMHFLSLVGTFEPTRNPEICTKLSEILGFEVKEIPNNDRSSADGVHMFQINGISITIAIMELKRELGDGDGGCDPSTQSSFNMRRSWIQADRADIRDKCCCPTLMIAGGGAWFGVLGGVFTDKVIIQRLTDLMWVGHSSTEEDARVYRFARVLAALRTCIGDLHKYYEDVADRQDLSLVSGRPHPRFYPYPTWYTAKNGQIIHFEYLQALEKNEPACVTYKARITSTSMEEFIVVKFVSRYNADVHGFLANEGHAPKLRYCGPLVPTANAGEHFAELLAESGPHGLSLGPLQMVVMDFVTQSEQTPADAHHQLSAILELLHAKGYVLGDLRTPNVLFNEQNKAIVIDLDWSGPFDMKVGDPIPDFLANDLQKKIKNIAQTTVTRPANGYVHYPLNLAKSVTSIGVADLEPIRPWHDWAMLHKYFPA